MYKFELGAKVRYAGRTVLIVGRWLMSSNNPWYEVRFVQGRGLTGHRHGVPERKLKA